MQTVEKIRCRWAPSLGDLEGKTEDVWDTVPYNPVNDLDKPCVFFGLYGLPDFYTLWRHRGKKWILWAGTDIIHFKNGYWLEGDMFGLRIDNKALAKWINTHCESWVENEVERASLAECGIKARVCPSFMGDIADYDITYQQSDKPKVYASVSGDNFEMYGWTEINRIACLNQDIEFHLYGNVRRWTTPRDNVIVHGRIPKEQMNAEIKEMQGGLRLLKHDGFSEILAKSILWGQWPVSSINYPHMLRVDEIAKIRYKKKPNLKGRSYYIKRLNKYPWVKK